MPHLTFATSPDGPTLETLIGLNDEETALLVTAGQPVPKPLRCLGIIDTGADFSAVAQRVIQQLGVTRSHTGLTHTASGQAHVNLFKVSLSISGPSGAAGPMFVHANLLVTELAVLLPKIEVLIGMDVLAECLLIVDGPAKQFTLAF